MTCSTQWHTLSSREPLDETLSSSDQASSSHSHMGLLGQPYFHVSQIRRLPITWLHSTQTSQGSHQKRRVCGCYPQRKDQGSPCLALLSAPSESTTKRAAARTSLAHSTPRMLCESSHYPTGPSKTRRPPSSASSTKVEENLSPHHCEASFFASLKPDLSHRFSRHFKPLSNATIESLRCSSTVPVVLYFFPKCWVRVLGHQTPLSCPLPPSFSKGLLLLTFTRLFCSRCLTHLIVVIVQLLSFAAIISFVDCLAKGMPISVNQGRSPPVIRYVINFEARFLGNHFLCSQRQFLRTSLMVASGHSSLKFGLRTENDLKPSISWPTSNALWLSTTKKFLKPSIILFLLLSQRPVTIL